MGLMDNIVSFLMEDQTQKSVFDKGKDDPLSAKMALRGLMSNALLNTLDAPASVWNAGWGKITGKEAPTLSGAIPGLRGAGPAYDFGSSLGDAGMWTAALRGIPTPANSGASRGTLASPNQVGAIRVWHGSPHKFDKFDSSKIGTGEGAQAYGHGGYFAESKNVAESYRDANSTYETFVNGKQITPDDPNFAAAMRIAGQGGYEKAKDSLLKMREDFSQYPKPPVPVSVLDQDLAALEKLKGAKVVQKQRGALYEADLRWPDAAREASDPLGPQHFLDWDKPLSEQPQAIKTAWNEMFGKNLKTRDVGPDLVDVYDSVRGGSLGTFQRNRVADVLANPADYYPFHGDNVYNWIGGVENVRNPGPESASVKASQELARRGIPGITYLDAGSRAAGEGTRNFVTFQDDLIDLLSRNGQPIPKPRPKTPFEIAHEVAQRNAALPVEQGGLGLPPGNTAMDRARAQGWDLDQFHYSRASEPFDQFTVNTAGRNTSFLDGLGVHTGTQKAAEDRFAKYWKGTKSEPTGFTMPLLIKDDAQLLKKTGAPYTESELKKFLESKAVAAGMESPSTRRDTQLALREALANKYDTVPYVNKVEGGGELSYITPKPQNIRSRFAAFDPFKKDSADLLAGLAGAGLLSPMLIDALRQER